MADLKLIVVLPGRLYLSDILTALFEPRHVRWHDAISSEIRRSMDGSIATSLKKSAFCWNETKINVWKTQWN